MAWGLCTNLHAMEQTLPTETSFSASSFAGFLASLTDPETPRPSARNEDGLEDDIATFSYEPALRAQTQYGSDPVAAGPVTALPAAPRPLQGDGESHEPPAPKFQPAEKPLKKASITIRLSESECAQIRQRAAEAGLTVSAYLRSCTLEVESLRTQVKDALAHLRNTAAPETAEVFPSRTSQPALWKRLKALVRPQRPALRLNAGNPLAPLPGRV